MVNGRRLQRQFPTRKEAEKFEREAVKEKKAHGAAALAMSHAQRLRYAAVEERLKKLGVTIEQAADWAEERVGAVKESILVPVLVTRFIESREEANCRPRYVQRLRTVLDRFGLRFGSKPAADVTEEDVRTWLFSGGWEAETQKGYLCDVRTMFNWAFKQRYVPRRLRLDDGEDIRIATTEKKEVRILTPLECGRLLMVALTARAVRLNRKTHRYEETYAFHCLIGYVALAMFAGVRPEEVKRSPRGVVDPEQRVAVVMAVAAKTRQRRPVKLTKNAALWLALWKRLCPDQPMVVPRNFYRLWRELRQAAGLLERWSHDVLRHTAATMHYALNENLATLQAMLGHSENEDTLFTNYRAVFLPDGSIVTEVHARCFFGIVPPANARD
jgi:integrase